MPSDRRGTDHLVHPAHLLEHGCWLCPESPDLLRRFVSPVATALLWGRLVEWHGYPDGVGEPVSSARMLGRSACSLQVPHRRAEAVECVAGREPVAVPYDVREGSGVSSVLAAAASGYGQALSAAKSPVQVAGL